MNRALASETPSPRIHILGASGTGTTTLGRALAERLCVPAFDVDDFYWYPDPPYERKRPIPERLELIARATGPYASWVLSGSLAGWGDPLIPHFTHVVFLSVPQEVRLERLRRRESQLFGEDAVAPGGWFHENFTKFLAWAALYEEGDHTIRSRRRHDAWLGGLSCPVLRLDGERPTDDLVDEVVAVVGMAAVRGAPSRV